MVNFFVAKKLIFSANLLLDNKYLIFSTIFEFPHKITKDRFDCTLILTLTPRLVDPIVVTLFVRKDEIVALPLFWKQSN